MAIDRSAWTNTQSKGSLDGQKREVFVHHTVSPNRQWTEAQEREHLRDVRAGHLARGFSDIGYHFLLFPSARLYEGRDVDLIPAAQQGHNTGTIAIAVVGTDPTLTKPQKDRLVAAVMSIKRNHPNVKALGGHRDVVATACPGGNVYGWLPKLRTATGLRKP